MTDELPEIRLKRMRMRSWRRGMKEMDLILGPFSDTHLAGLAESDLLIYDLLLNENDQEIYTWFTGAATPPDKFSDLIGIVAAVVK